jgi:hypothetical protein
LRAMPHRSSVSRVAWSRLSRKTSTDAAGEQASEVGAQSTLQRAVVGNDGRADCGGQFTPLSIRAVDEEDVPRCGAAVPELATDGKPKLSEGKPNLALNIPVMGCAMIDEQLRNPGVRISGKNRNPHNEHADICARIPPQDVLLHPTGARLARVSARRQQDYEPSGAALSIEGSLELTDGRDRLQLRCAPTRSITAASNSDEQHAEQQSATA